MILGGDEIGHQGDNRRRQMDPLAGSARGTIADRVPPLPNELRTGASPQSPAIMARGQTGDHDLFIRPDIPIWRIRGLRPGCYLLRYTPYAPWSFVSLHYDGTLRVEGTPWSTIASGDLYSHSIPLLWAPGIDPTPSPEPNPSSGIPSLRRSAYRYYVRVTEILRGFTPADSFRLGFELHRFTAATNTWVNEGAFTATMAWVTAPPSYPSGSDYLTGEVVNTSSGSAVGTLTMGWVSPYLRRAIVEIDRVAASEAPLNNGAGVDWRAIFDEVGWDVTVVESETNVAEPSGESWSDAELHAAMLNRRDSADLDREWRYHVLCVRRLDDTERGIMYDAFASDSNNVPREGLGLASHWVPTAPEYGRIRGMRFGTASSAYFRTAVHELGHALGLYHNTLTMGIMNTTDVIAHGAVPPTQFPDNIEWSFEPDDQKRLRHMPDIWVRPGGTAFGHSYSSSPISPGDHVQSIDGLTLRVSPLLEAVPIGAPVRINLSLVNEANQPLQAPRSLSLKTGFVTGRITDPSGTARAFRPLIRCADEQAVTVLAPGEAIEHSITLLRGPEGALFPAPGVYQITVHVEWDIFGVPVGVEEAAAVMVTGAQTASHTTAALRVLSSPDALLTLVLGGDHLPEGMGAIQSALGDEVLRPHFAVVEAKRLSRRFGKREPDLDAAAELLPDAVVTPAEIRSVAELLLDVDDNQAQARERMAATLCEKATEFGASDEVISMVRQL